LEKAAFGYQNDMKEIPATLQVVDEANTHTPRRMKKRPGPR
jgi:hypothetical protein